MSSYDSGRVRVALKAAAAILAIATLLAFPIRKPHQFANHFRPTELCRTMERLVTVAQPRPAEPGEIADQFSRVGSAAHALVEVSFTPLVAPAPVTDAVPLTRMLMRLKLGRTSSDPRDPLL